MHDIRRIGPLWPVGMLDGFASDALVGRRVPCAACRRDKNGLAFHVDVHFTTVTQYAQIS